MKNTFILVLALILCASLAFAQGREEKVLTSQSRYTVVDDSIRIGGTLQVDKFYGIRNGAHYPWKVVGGASSLTLWVTNQQLAGAVTAGTMTPNKLVAWPWVPPYTFTTDSANVEVSGAADGGIMWGVYKNESDTTLYPGRLLFSKYDTCSIAVKGKSLAGGDSITFEAGKVYWVAINAGCAATMREIPLTSIWGGMGSVAGLGSNYQASAVTVDRNIDYTLPSTFTASATVLANRIALQIQFHRK